jgi:hypothetical protein
MAMADMQTGPVPDIDAVAMGRLRDQALAETEAQLAAPNPHGTDMQLPRPLLEDGGLGS